MCCGFDFLFLLFSASDLLIFNDVLLLGRKKTNTYWMKWMDVLRFSDYMISIEHSIVLLDLTQNFHLKEYALSETFL